MARYGNSVISGPVTVVWDGITRPEMKKDKNNQDKLQYSLAVAMHTAAPEVAEINAIVQEALNKSEWRGVMPAGGGHPLHPIDASQYEGKLPAHIKFNAKTWQLPQVFGPAYPGNPNDILQPQTYGPMLYAGATVRVVVSAYAYNSMGNKGIALNLDGIQIIDATTPRLPVGGVDAGAAFAAAGGAPAPGGAPMAPAPGAMPAPPPAPMAAQAPAPAGPVMTAAAQYTYEQYKAAGWTDAALVSGGLMAAAPAAAPPAMPAAPAVTPPAAPAPGFLAPTPPVPAAPAPAGPRMTAKAAGVTYDQFKAQGWNDDQLRGQGYME